MEKRMMIAWMMALAGCATEDTDSGCFWCTDTGVETQGDGDSKDSDSKDSKDSKDSEASPAVWLASVHRDLSAGTIEYAFTDEGGAGSCELAVTLGELADTDACDSCTFAATMTVSAVAIIADNGACDLVSDPMVTEGTTLAFGQGATSYGEYGGIEYFELLQEQDGNWKVLSGYSVTYQDNSTEIWSFGIK
jgi:hypothetical protein